MNKPLFKSSKAIHIPSHKYNLKVLAGIFSVAMILFLSLSMLKISLQVRAETSIPKPSVPEFTVKLIDSSYDVPTTYSIDPYTGENVTHPSTHVDNRTIEVKIKNQPFTPYNDSGWIVGFYYNVRTKGHYEKNWTALYFPEDVHPTQSNSDYTVISYTLGGDAYSPFVSGFPAGAQVDFQVEAMIGYFHRVVGGASAPWVFTGETSGWSNTQTLTISESQTPQTPNSSPANSPTPTPESPQTDITVIAGVAIVALVLGAGAGLLIFLKRK